MLSVVMVRVVPITSLHPWDDWIPPDLHGFFSGFLILLRL